MFTRINRRALLLLHGESLALHGGTPGIRNENLLDSALTRPENLEHHHQPDAFDCAAAEAFELAKNLPFNGGNKRAGFLGAGMFLRLNGYRLTASPQDAALTMLALAASELSEMDYADWLRQHSAPLKP
jgi:death-on-curing protein